MKKLITLFLITSSILVQAQNNINLPQGWSMFGYNCATPLDVELAFTSITDKIVIVKDHLGNAYLPEANFNGVGNLMPSTGYQIKMTETVEGFEFCEAVVPEDGVTQSDVDAVQALLDAVVPEDGITQSDVDVVQALLDAVVPEDGITQSDVDSVQVILDSVVPEDGITQADVDAAVSAVQEEYIGWCLSDINNDGICDETFIGEIGDLAHGGIVFYIDETGEHGLVAALEDITEGSNMGSWGTPEGFEWGCHQQTVSGADGQSIGTGYQNTLDIVAQNCQSQNGGITAAQATLNYETEGYTDWFLPSRSELNEMYNTIGNGGLQDNIYVFETNDSPYYWSSSENSNNLACIVHFGNGNTNFFNKANSLRVRAVRAF